MNVWVCSAVSMFHVHAYTGAQHKVLSRSCKLSLRLSRSLSTVGFWLLISSRNILCQAVMDNGPAAAKEHAQKIQKGTSHATASPVSAQFTVQSDISWRFLATPPSSSGLAPGFALGLVRLGLDLREWLGGYVHRSLDCDPLPLQPCVPGKKNKLTFQSRNVGCCCFISWSKNGGSSGIVNNPQRGEQSLLF